MIVIVSQKAKMLCFLVKILLIFSIYAQQSCFKLKLVTLYKFINKAFEENI